MTDLRPPAAIPPHDPARPLPHLLREQPCVRPDHPAVVAPDRTLTYRELDAAANRLAHYLRRLGAEPEARVGLCVERSSWMAVGVLGVLRSGAAFVPLDPSHPPERRARVLADAGVGLLLTAGAPPPEGYTGRTVDLEAKRSRIEGEPEGAPPGEPGPDHLAYAIYTSGSTGSPKGVMIPHGSLAHFVPMAAAALGIGPEDVYLHSASAAFAVAVRQLLAPLFAGATVVLAGAREVRDAAALFELVRRRGVTVVDLVPSHLRGCTQALAALAPERRAALLRNPVRQVVCVGEPLTADVVRAWREELGQAAPIVNLYGQTETTGFVTAWPAAADEGARVPIGRAAGGTPVYLLDPDMAPVGDGEPGELYVGGPALARGYLGRPDLTAGRFVPDPFGGHGTAGARLYRTGDLARRRPDGALEHLGRADHQVKVRGVRVEPEEVEAALRLHPGVRDAAVVGRSDDAGEGSLAAFLVADPPPAPDELRAFLRRTLPEHMVPASFTAVAALPTTRSGKLDRAALGSRAASPSTGAGTGRRPVGEWLYLPRWTRSPLPAAPGPGPAAGPWLVFAREGCALGAAVVERLRERGDRAALVLPGEGFARVGERTFRVHPARDGDYEALFRALRNDGGVPRRVLHMWSVGEDPAGDGAGRTVELGFDGLLLLARALAAEPHAEGVRVGVVSSGVQSVTGREPLHPERAALLGVCRVLPLEHPEIGCCAVDVEAPGTGAGARALAAELLPELDADGTETVALRGGERWVEGFEPVGPDGGRTGALPVRADGVYLVTGGLGGVGLALTEGLARAGGTRLVLVGRSGLPERGEWDGWLARRPDDRTSRRIRGVRRLEQLGAEVLVLAADVTDPAATRAAVERALGRFGALHGVVHAAGTVGVFRPLRRLTPAAAAEVLVPKLRGARVLEQALRDVPLDFLVLCSSLSSVLGRLEQADYCAANAFLDVLARERSARGLPTVSVDWDVWRDAWTGGTGGGHAVRGEEREDAISSGEGMEAFAEALRIAAPQLVVSTRDLHLRMAEREAFFRALPGGAPRRAPRPALAAEFVPPRTEVERAVAAVWEEVLGVGPVGVHDEFFALGGHSLHAMRAAARIGERLGCDLSAHALFDASTVSALAARVTAAREPTPSGGDLAALLDGLDSLSEEDAERVLAELQRGGTR